LLLKILLPRLTGEVHVAQVIGADVPVSLRKAGNGTKGEEGTEEPISAGRQLGRALVLSGASREEAPEEVIFLSCDAAPGFF
jgi:hypothetical protein